LLKESNMGAVCPYFKDNRCVLKDCSELQMEMSEIVLCATGAHVDCPVYIETIRREKKEVRKIMFYGISYV